MILLSYNFNNCTYIMTTIVPIDTLPQQLITIVPQQLITVLAIRVDKFHCYIRYNNEYIIINVINKDTHLKYMRILYPDCQYWKLNSQYFEDNFLLFGKFLKTTLHDKEGEYYFDLNQYNWDMTILINQACQDFKDKSKFIIKLNIYLNFHVKF